MPSLQDLPNEILYRIELAVPELLSLFLVNKRFYELYIGDIYSKFEHLSLGWNEEVNVRKVDQLQRFFVTTISSPALADYVKSLVLTGAWREDLCSLSWLYKMIIPLTRQWFLKTANVPAHAANNRRHYQGPGHCNVPED